MACASAAFAFAASSCASTCAFVSSAFAVSTLMTPIIASTSSVVFAITGPSSTSSSFMTSILPSVSDSLSRPFWSRDLDRLISSRFSFTSRMNV